MAIRQRLAEIAQVAGTLAPWMPDEVRSTLFFELSGYAVSYVISDAHRTLTVLALVDAEQYAERYAPAEEHRT